MVFRSSFECIYGFVPLFLLYINSRVHIVHVLLVQFIPQELDRFTKALEVNNFPLSQKFDHIVHIRVVADA